MRSKRTRFLFCACVLEFNDMHTLGWGKNVQIDLFPCQNKGQFVGLLRDTSDSVQTFILN